jgi:mRNA-degrading endonuclease RelE of RelBE toxin-antitoxin system
MPEYEIRLTKEALKDLKKHPPRLKIKLKEILQNRIAIDPYSGKKLVGYLSGFYSVRLSYQDRIVYSIDDAEAIVYIHRVKTHYGN